MAESRTRRTLAALLALAGLGLSGLRAQDVTIKGKIRIGQHRQQLEKGKLYRITVDADGFRPLVSIRPDYFIHERSGEGDSFQAHFVPRETRDYTLSITPDLFDDLGQGVLKYTAKIRNIPLAAKPLLAEAAELTNKDPFYKIPDSDSQRKCHFKAYSLKMKAGRFYVINMERKDNLDRMDPYLYLEGPNGKVLAQDDDSGGDLNARLVFQPRRDGEYRIIATTLAPATGEFRLTVRAQETE
jgi:hypothetical protein